MIMVSEQTNELNAKKIANELSRLNLLDYVRRIHYKTKDIIKNCLDPNGEKIMIIGDIGLQSRRIAPMLAMSYYLAAKELNVDVNILMDEPKKSNQKLNDSIIESIFDLPDKSILMLSLSNKLGSMNHLGKSFRTYCKDHKHRFISTTSLGSIRTADVSFIMSALDVDYNGIRRYDSKIKGLFDRAKEVYVETRAGTKVYFDIKGLKAISADGFYDKPGTGGNIPAGEVYMPMHSAEGKIVVDASSRNSEGTLIVKKPFKIFIEKGSIDWISGEEEAKVLRKSLEKAEKRAKYPNRVWKIGELGIGTNPKAEIVGSTIIDEKVYKTAHIGIGSNYWFGGNNKTIVHFDQVFRNPRIFVDGKRVRI